jgi:hypothetical protein
MDAITQLHLLDRLETLREAQIRHGEMLREILRLIRERLPGVVPLAPPTPAPISPGFWRLAAETGRYWLGGIALIIWVWRGGDIGTALQHFFK